MPRVVTIVGEEPEAHKRTLGTATQRRCVTVMTSKPPTLRAPRLSLIRASSRCGPDTLFRRTPANAAPAITPWKTKPTRQRQVVVKQPGTRINCYASMYVVMKKAGEGDILKGFEEV